MERDMDERVWAVAAAQHGALTRAQAHEAGMKESAIKRRVAAGRWEAVGRHAFRLAGSPSTWRQSTLLAVMDAGPGAVATGRGAGALWSMPGCTPSTPEVLVERGRHHRPALGRLRETRLLAAHHVTTRDAIPVVTPARLVVELAGREHPGRVERALDAALSAGLLRPEDFALVVAELAHRGRRGRRSCGPCSTSGFPATCPRGRARL